MENKQQSEHYQKEKFEAIDVIEDVLDDLEGIINNKQASYIKDILKYTLRLGKKDEIKKEQYKIADYFSRLVSGKWVHENRD